MFAIGICDKQTGLQEGLCDIHFEHPISVEKLQAIVNICNEQIMEPIRSHADMEIIDTLRAIADIIVLEKGSIEVDLNLQYAGTKTFARGVTDAVLLFVRGDMLWPANIFEWNNAEHAEHAVHALHTFLFQKSITFDIGVVENEHRATLCVVTMLCENLNPLVCKELIHLLEELVFGLSDADIPSLMNNIQAITGGSVLSGLPHPFEGMTHVELIFIKGMEENYRTWTYNGNITEMVEFLRA